MKKVELSMYETYHSGWIETITGSMFSGKSEELIRRLRRGIYAKQKVVVFKPAIDDRYHKEKVVSHNGNEIEAINISTAQEILNHKLEKVNVIGIDEVQFFEDDIVNIVEKLAENGHRVIVAGLDWILEENRLNLCPSCLQLVNILQSCKQYVLYVVHLRVVHNG